MRTKYAYRKPIAAALCVALSFSSSGLAIMMGQGMAGATVQMSNEMCGSRGAVRGTSTTRSQQPGLQIGNDEANPLDITGGKPMVGVSFVVDKTLLNISKIGAYNMANTEVSAKAYEVNAVAKALWAKASKQTGTTGKLNNEPRIMFVAMLSGEDKEIAKHNSLAWRLLRALKDVSAAFIARGDINDASGRKDFLGKKVGELHNMWVVFKAQIPAKVKQAPPEHLVLFDRWIAEAAKGIVFLETNE